MRERNIPVATRPTAIDSRLEAAPTSWIHREVAGMAVARNRMGLQAVGLADFVG